MNSIIISNNNDWISWSDYDFEVSDYTIFFSPQLDKNIITRLVFRLFEFFGFGISVGDKSHIIQIKKIDRTENGITVGLCSERNYPKISYILKFLRETF